MHYLLNVTKEKTSLYFKHEIMVHHMSKWEFYDEKQKKKKEYARKKFK